MRTTLWTLVMFPLLCLAAPVTVHVELSPTGSFDAKSEALKGHITKQDGVYTAHNVSLKAETLDTGIELRNEHMLKRLGGKDATIQLMEAEGKNGKGKARLTLKGKEVPVLFTFKEKGNMIHAYFKLRASSLGITDVSYLGVGVEDELSVEAQLPLH